MFFAFLGFGPLPWRSTKSRNHQRTSLAGLSSVFLITTVLLYLGHPGFDRYGSFKNLNVDDAVAFALRQVGAGWAGNYVSLVAILTLITVCISMTFALSRMIYSLARDGLLPKL